MLEHLGRSGRLEDIAVTGGLPVRIPELPVGKSAGSDIDVIRTLFSPISLHRAAQLVELRPLLLCPCDPEGLSFHLLSSIQLSRVNQ